MPPNMHIRIFFAHNGPGPFVFHFCKKKVTLEKVHVHHVDHNHDNNKPKNLVASHSSCHSRHHATGRLRSKETRERISATRKEKFSRGELVPPTKGVGHSAKTRAKISVSHMGIRPSDESLEKLRTSHIGIPKSPETLARMSESMRGKNRQPSPNKGKHVGSSAALRSWETRRKNQLERST